MLDDRIGHKKKKIKSNEIKVFPHAEYGPGIKTGGLAISEQMDI